MKFVLPLLLLFGCSDNARNTTTGTTGSTNGSTNGSTTGTGGMGDMAMQSGGGGCLDIAKLVYVVDENNTFLSFDPATLQFAVLGTLSCPNTAGDNPFSMAVDRSATAWVLYASGRIFK